jgi:hypothetical protein
MSYATIQPPFSLRFREMPKAELRAYLDWFLGQIPERIAQLEQEVRLASAFYDWAANKSPDSLTALGAWFVTQVETRKRTTDEMAALRASGSFPVNIPEDELTNRTFSLAMDLGMYLAETLRAQHPKLKWQQPLDDPKFADFGQPVLVGFGAVPLNPVRIVLNLAYGIAGKKQDGARLVSLYAYWANQAAKAKC